MSHISPFSPPLRIAYCINSMEGGGAASPVPAILGVLRRCGAEVRVFALTRRDGHGIAAIEDAGFAVTVREGGERDHLAALGWLIRELRGWRASHVWTSLTRATLLGQIAGARLSLPVASWQHAAFLRPANRRLLRWNRRRSNLWIADSDSVASLTAERLRITPGRLVTWPIFRADPHAPQARSWRPGEPMRIGSLGRLHRVKGYDVLLDAAARLRAADRQFELIIGGEGGERERLIAQARSLGLDNVHFPGFIADPQGFLADLHLYVQPSWSEGFCIAAHEAMQAGLPVVASIVGELQHSVRPGVTGELVPPGAAEILACKISAMLGAPQRMDEMGAQARAMVLERFGPDRFEAAGRAVVQRLLDLSDAPADAGFLAGPRSPDHGTTTSSA